VLSKPVNLPHNQELAPKGVDSTGAGFGQLFTRAVKSRAQYVFSRIVLCCSVVSPGVV